MNSLSKEEVEGIFNRCSREEYYLPRSGHTYDIAEVVRKCDKIEIEIDIGSFVLSQGGGMGELQITTDNQIVIDYYNAAKLWPFGGPSASESEIENTRYCNKPSAAPTVFNQWLDSSNKVIVRNI